MSNGYSEHWTSNFTLTMQIAALLPGTLILIMNKINGKLFRIISHVYFIVYYNALHVYLSTIQGSAANVLA